jgi:hypothetical protein
VSCVRSRGLRVMVAMCHMSRQSQCHVSCSCHISHMPCVICQVMACHVVLYVVVIRSSVMCHVKVVMFHVSCVIEYRHVLCVIPCHGSGIIYMCLCHIYVSCHMSYPPSHVLYIKCHVSCSICHRSCVICPAHRSCGVTCHVSFFHVSCVMSCVMCHNICHLSWSCVMGHVSVTGHVSYVVTLYTVICQFRVMSQVMFQVSCVMFMCHVICHMSSVLCPRAMCQGHVSCVMVIVSAVVISRHMSGSCHAVMCHVSCPMRVMCHVSCVMLCVI